MPIDYLNGKIYKLISNQTDKIYIGSTCQSLCKRYGDHNSHYRYWKKTNNNYVTSFEIIQYDDCDIILLENYSCQNKNELHAKERHWIEQLDCVNKIVPTRTQSEYQNDNNDQIKEYDKNRYYNEKKNNEKYQEKVKEYREQNKEKINEYNKQYYNDNAEKIKETVAKYRNNNKYKIAERDKKYRENNKEKIAEIDKIYQNLPEVKEKNKERLKKYREKTTCDICNYEIARDSIYRHNISKKHINNTQKSS
jgi:hypothetical protein